MTVTRFPGCEPAEPTPEETAARRDLAQAFLRELDAVLRDGAQRAGLRPREVAEIAMEAAAALMAQAFGGRQQGAQRAAARLEEFARLMRRDAADAPAAEPPVAALPPAPEPAPAPRSEPETGESDFGQDCVRPSPR